MADLLPKQRQERQHRISKPQRKKLDRLPANAKVTKRPLFRPAIPSPYAGASQQKVVYVSARTPFLSAIKRVEKLLHLSDRRLVQSATTLAKQKNGKRKRSGRNEDEILDIATEVERQRGKKRKTNSGAPGVYGEENDFAGEEVTLKGTGKAIARVMELALWFQQKEEYTVRLRTGTVGAIDDIEVDEGVTEAAGDKAPTPGEAMEGDGSDPIADAMEGADAGADAGADDDGDDDDRAGGVSLAEHPGSDGVAPDKVEVEPLAAPPEKEDVSIPETRVRYTSVLEVAVSLR
ncbi:hypothetical protein LTR85_010279 [Meristemomyces frigidus]|nr:hypothetical protein LTR85_010279 [Meristemomyces frigidus]